MRAWFVLHFMIISFLLLATETGRATVQFPTNLDRHDRREAVRILGFGSSSKILSDPYPLGGYDGFEFGISVENLPVEDLGRLGDTLSTPQQDVAYPKFSIGKGLYNNLDLFVQFIPYSQKNELSQYGGILRWGFYQATFLPLSLSLLAHVNSSNISNLVTTRSLGLDLIGGINVDNVALFIGVGTLQSRGRFIGSPSGITDTHNIEQESVSGFHSVLGINVHFANYFVAAQVDRYSTAVSSAKIGLRF